jgi:isopentenyl diphosphate isomerase/L-lactate dehydrogenase-like FMN-dependent dehydrogenase
MSDLEFENLHEIVKRARQNLNHNNWDYLVGGSESETTLRRNRLALDTIAFRPRVLRDVSEIDLSTTFLGRKLRLPVVLAPVGSLELFESGGGATAARAAGQFGVAAMLSSVCQPGLETVAQAAPEAARMFQLYVHGDAAWVKDICDRATAHGYIAFCLTVDTAVYSRRERDLAKRHFRRRNVPGRVFQSKLNWKDVERIKGHLKIPLALKGIATAEDAKLAVQHGVDIVYVSNHGGRQLDHGRGSMDVLSEIVDAVAGKARIIIDGGFNRGTDIVKAITMGADLVGMGRMEAAAMAAGGQAGVVRMLELVEHEMQSAFGLLGVTKWSELDKSFLHPGAPVAWPQTLSAFPLLNLDDRTFY